MNPARTSLAALLLVLLTACQTLPQRPLAANAMAAPVLASAEPAANDNLNAVIWMQAALEYRLLAGQTYRSALNELDRALKTPDWDALAADERANPATGLPPAIIVDVDETVLDNSAYQARLIRDNAAYDEITWDNWVREEAALPVPGAVEFAKAATARGVTIFYITNRVEHLNAQTLSNLRKAGFPIAEPGQFLGLGTFVEGCEQYGSEKGCRRQLIGRSHRVLMQFGDQISDMANILVNTPEGREQAMKPYLGWIGERWFILPNPSYGGWEPALFNNAWELPPSERRQLKLDALRYR